MTKIVKSLMLSAVIVVAVQPTRMCAANNQQSSKFWKFGLIGAGVGAAMLGFTYLFNRFTSIPLQSAVSLNCNSIAKMLVYCGADVNQGFIDGRALWIAAKNGNLEMVRYLVQQGADVNDGDCTDWGTAIYVASYNGHLDIVEYLIKNGATVGKAVLESAHKSKLPGCVLKIVKLAVEHGKYEKFDYFCDDIGDFYSEIKCERPKDIAAYLELADDFHSLARGSVDFTDFAKKYLKLNDKKQVKQNCEDVKKLLHFDTKNNVSKKFDDCVKKQKSGLNIKPFYKQDLSLKFESENQ